MLTYTTTYPNPDTDGIVCAIAFAEFLRSARGKNAQAVIKGRVDDETTLVLELFSERHPRIVETCSEADEIYLFDTHHMTHVIDYLECSKVVEIIDHHPSGNPEAFENASITNELVGAAATLVTERFRKADYGIPPLHAGLLYAAIISNTLEFTAPTTTGRDKAAAEWLGIRTDIPRDLPRLMFAARSAFGTRSTPCLLESDCKLFRLGGHDVAICQIEGVGVEQVLNREDLYAALASLATARGTDFVFLSVVDILARKTTLVPANEVTAQVLTRALGLTFEKGMVTVNRILLRKSDLVPALKNLLETS
jgi:manganese-dependent inorganic pyrophosphatase